jgi:hypothetical protein
VLRRQLWVLHHVLVSVMLISLCAKVFCKGDTLMIGRDVRNSIKPINWIDLALERWTDAYNNFKIVTTVG